jgi:uncharacterized protein YndB with AHSA1/START domain
MLKDYASIMIERPPEQVFAFLSDPENIPKWQAGVTESKLVSPGNLGVGVQFHETVRVMGRRMNVVCEITEYDPVRKLTFRSISNTPIQFVGGFTFEPTNGGTTLSYVGTTSLKGLLRLIEPLFGSEVKRELENEMKRIKVVLEAQA